MLEKYLAIKNIYQFTRDMLAKSREYLRVNLPLVL
jgi:hypothetical protein